MANKNASPNGVLRAELEAARDNGNGRRLTMNDLTVLSTQRDPYRLDTVAGHRDAAWGRDLFNRVIAARGKPEIHCRGLHYAAIDSKKPNGKQYINTDAEWDWIQTFPLKRGRWLLQANGLPYIPFEGITDERNAEPLIRKYANEGPSAVIHVGEVEIELPGELTPTVGLDGFYGRQPFRLAIFGEKTSLRDVLDPIAETYRSDLYLPTGESSDNYIFRMAKAAAEDGRRLIVFYFSDCDPDGFEMAADVGHKLRPLRTLRFGDLSFEMRPIALTPDQVREYGLPITPLKNPDCAEAKRWVQQTGVQQTEIDALATLKPDLLDKLARDAIRPFFDSGLVERVRKVRHEWEAEAQQVLEDALGEDELERIRTDAQDKLDKLEELREQVTEAMTVDADRVDLPDIPEVPRAQAKLTDIPALVSSDMSFAEAVKRLKGRKEDYR
jgi:hypothetical protein